MLAERGARTRPWSLNHLQGLVDGGLEPSSCILGLNNSPVSLPPDSLVWFLLFSRPKRTAFLRTPKDPIHSLIDSLPAHGLLCARLLACPLT